MRGRKINKVFCCLAQDLKQQLMRSFHNDKAFFRVVFVAHHLAIVYDLEHKRIGQRVVGSCCARNTLLCTKVYTTKSITHKERTSCLFPENDIKRVSKRWTNRIQIVLIIFVTAMPKNLSKALIRFLLILSTNKTVLFRMKIAF